LYLPTGPASLCTARAALISELRHRAPLSDLCRTGGARKYALMDRHPR